MGVPDELFDEDYSYFYADILTAARSDVDAEVVGRLLGAHAGMKVLDVPCGQGRIAGRLAARGCDVVGVDNNPGFLAHARAAHPQVAFELGDMRSLPYAGEFDAVVNWFTSFGYFDPDTNDEVLAGFARALRPGGQLLLELHNPARLARLLDITGGASAMLTEREGNLMIDRVTLNAMDGRSRTERFIVRDGQVRKLEFSLEQVPASRLVPRLERAGFGDVRLFGRDGGPFEPEGPRLIALARR